MAVTIEKRIRWTVLGAILITFFITVVAVLVANENLERAMLELDFQSERAFVLEHAKPGEALAWDTATLKAYFAPVGVPVDERLPAVFQGLPLPFSDELELNGTTFLITTGQVQGGTFYLAKDITAFENREAEFHAFLIALGIVVVSIGVLLARITGKRLVAPIQRLTAQIRDTAPAARMRRVEDVKDVELNAIVRSFNLFLGELETYVKREQSLMGLASHELRTPIAVIAGALDVIEQRGGMQGSDKGPLLRMRRAVDEMAANIDVILKLTRRKSVIERRESIDFAAMLAEVEEDLARHLSDVAGRVSIAVEASPVVYEDPALVKMLLRNVIQNAVQHTPGRIFVSLTASAIEIQDEGAGLPQAYLTYLNDPRADVGDVSSLSGLGLFIVTLICERLAWALQAVPSAEGGTIIRIVPKAKTPT
ncbi:MAG: HAMP domain-containing histidine kinase [Burkholderiaceae bacterium]|nr:HAMP domain-containing histidine kinase [Burkholderiaceae bacterium]